MEEWSSNGQNRILNQADNDTGFFKEGKGYILLDFDLGIANFPDKYSTTLGTTVQFVKDGNLCTLRDRSFAVAMPPPEYVITESPNRLILEPGHNKTIELLIKSLTNLDSSIFLSPKTPEYIDVSFAPNQMFLPASEEDSISVTSKCFKKCKSRFPTNTTYRCKDHFSTSSIP